jgi:ankyrin repeat protein
MNARREGDGLLPAMHALYGGDEKKAYTLLPADEELTAHEAATFGRERRLQALLDEDPNRAGEFSPDGFSPLHGAVFGGHAKTVQLLLERGADPNVRASSSIARVPPLGTAAFVRRTDLAELLLDGGADPNGQGEGGFTALDAAAQNEDEDLIALLLSRGADPEVGAGIARERLKH